MLEMRGQYIKSYFLYSILSPYYCEPPKGQKWCPKLMLQNQSPGWQMKNLTNVKPLFPPLMYAFSSFFANSLQAVFDQLVIDACCDQPIILMGLKSLDEVKVSHFWILSLKCHVHFKLSKGKSPRDASFPFQEDPENVLYIHNHLYRYSS